MPTVHEVYSTPQIQEPLPQQDLPKFLTDLRDGIAPEAKNAGKARAKRIERMRNDLNLIQEFLDDLDRYSEHAKDAPLTGRDVGPFMTKYIEETRARAIVKARELYSEMKYIQEHSA